MSECLVTTLKDSVTDANLLKLDEIRFHINSSSPVYLYVEFAANAVGNVTVGGEGYITDVTATSNLGKQKALERYNIMYFSAGDYDVTVDNKANITNFTWQNGTDYLSLCPVGIDTSSFMGTPKITKLWLDGGNLSGDVDNIFKIPALVNLSAPSNTGKKNYNLTGSIDSVIPTSSYSRIEFRFEPNVGGNLSSLSTITSLQRLSLSGTNVEGNLVSLANLTNLQALALDSTKVVGDTSSLANLTNLTTFTYTNTAITGTWPLV